jgi:lipopolysaccharide/colanic/teichoic acid biosynthesis glycosyltransferase
MSISVIDNDRERLNAKHRPGQLRMTSNSPAIRVRKDAEGRTPVERVGSDALTTNLPPRKTHVDQGGVTYLSAEPRHDFRTSTDCPRTARVPYHAAKRVIDVGLGSVLLLIATPVILIAAAAIRLESKGSPFFVQTRLGKNGRPFKIVKLRGMFRDARERFPSYYDYSNKENLDFCFHHEVDPRVTRAGNFIRKTSIDELPNLLNVVLGDISLVGPRPEIPEVMALYGTFRDEYLSVKPGVTCLSKCTGRDRLTKRETIEYDLDYVRRRNFRVDIQILWRTFRGVVMRRDVF